MKNGYYRRHTAKKKITPFATRLLSRCVYATCGPAAAVKWPRRQWCAGARDFVTPSSTPHKSSSSSSPDTMCARVVDDTRWRCQQQYVIRMRGVNDEETPCTRTRSRVVRVGANWVGISAPYTSIWVGSIHTTWHVTTKRPQTRSSSVRRRRCQSEGQKCWFD